MIKFSWTRLRLFKIKLCLVLFGNVTTFWISHEFGLGHNNLGQGVVHLGADKEWKS